MSTPLLPSATAAGAAPALLAPGGIALVTRGSAGDLGVAGLAPGGLQGHPSLEALCAATLDDLRVEGYLLHVDRLRNAAALRSLCREAAARGKPVIAWKPARPAVAAASQVGALADEEDVAEVFLRDLGVALVHAQESLLPAFQLAVHLPLPEPGEPPRRLGIACTVAGGAAAVAQALAARQVRVTPPSEDLVEQLAGLGLAASATGAVLQLAGVAGDALRQALGVLQEAPEFDLVLAVLASGGRFGPPFDAKPVIACAAGPRPPAVLLAPPAPDALAALARAGIPCFPGPEECVDAMAAVLLRRSPGMQPATQEFDAAAARTLPDEQAHALLDALGIARAPAVAMRLSQPPASLPFPFPVTVRVSSPRIPHKEDIGAVLHGVADAAQLAAAFGTLRRKLAARAPEACCDEVLVQPACSAVTQVMLGYRVDPQAGPLVMLAAGGIWADVARDRSLRLAPVGLEAARGMVGEVQALRRTAGADLQALAGAVAALSQLAVKPDLRIMEAELSPLAVLAPGAGVRVLAARILQA